MSESELPEGWRWIKLGEVSTKVTKGTTPTSLGHQYTADGIPFLRAENVRGGPVDPATAAYHISPDTHKVLKRSQLLPGDLLLTIAGTIGRVGYVSGDAPPMNCNQAVSLARLDTDVIDSGFACFACQHPDVINPLIELKAGGALKNLNLEQVKNLRIPLPPLDEQRRIAAILDEQMAAVQQARAAAQAQLEGAQALMAAYLREVFESEEAQGWPIYPLGEVGEVKSGITKGRRINEDAEVSPTPYLRVANVKDGHLDLDEVYAIDVTEKELEKYHLEYGDLLLTEGGDPDKLGRGAFWEEQIPNCIHQNHIFRVRFDLSAFLPQFLSVQIGSRYGKSYFLAHAKQTTGIATINQKVLKGFPLMAPPLSEQKRIAEIIAGRRVPSEEAWAALQDQLDLLDALPGALLRRAFAGEL